MASRKSDIEVQSLVTDEALASQLSTGQQVRLVQVEDSPEVQIHSDQGSLIGVVVDLPHQETASDGHSCHQEPAEAAEGPRSRPHPCDLPRVPRSPSARYTLPACIHLLKCSAR